MSPWGSLLLSRKSGQVLEANEQIKVSYCHGLSNEVGIEQVFEFPGTETYQAIVSDRSKPVYWNGRVNAIANVGGVTSTEVLLAEDPDDVNLIWLHTLEHPVVSGVQRFSSRSELRMLQLLLENTLELVFVCDSEKRIIIANTAFKEALALSPDQHMTGLRLEEFVSDSSADWLNNIDDEVKELGEPSINRVSYFKFKNGKAYWLQMTTVPVVEVESGSFIGTVHVARDIGDLKKTETELLEAIREAKAASRAKGEFLASISHEIRTPINGIIGASELCMEANLNDEQSGYLQTVLNCSGTLLSLVNDVLDFSKIEAGHIKLERVSFELEKLLNSVIDEFRPQVDRKGLSLHLEYSDDLPDRFMGDPTRLKQIIYNLVGNALKFTADGFVSIRVRAVKKMGKSIQLMITVKDTGIGITKAALTSIFDSFTQADMTTTRKYGGTGLGLAICKRLSDLMDAEIKVESEIGVGSIFSLQLCLDLSNESVVEHALDDESEVGLIKTTGEDPLSVLLVEDNVVNQKIARIRIEKLGEKVQVADNGLKGVKLWREGSFDCILMDVQMPVMDGHEATREIRKIEAEEQLDPIYIVAMTAHAFKEDRDKCIAAGMDKYISKPFRVEDLERIFAEVKVLKAEHSETREISGEIFDTMAKEVGLTGKDDFQEVAELFMETSKKDLENLKKSFLSKDYESFAFTAHRLKGALGVFCQHDLFELAKALEEAYLDLSSEEMETLYEEFVSKVSKFRTALKKEILA
jgi:PAS domain S-box-containing protein